MATPPTFVLPHIAYLSSGHIKICPIWLLLNSAWWDTWHGFLEHVGDDIPCLA